MFAVDLLSQVQMSDLMRNEIDIGRNEGLPAMANSVNDETVQQDFARVIYIIIYIYI